MISLLSNALRRGTRTLLEILGIVCLAASLPAQSAAPAPGKDFAGRCGAAGSRCDSAMIRQFYLQYRRQVMASPGGDGRNLERLAGGAQQVDSLLKSLLAAGYAVRSEDVRDFTAHLYDADSVWLYSEPHHAGVLKQFRRSAAVLAGDVSYRSLRVGERVYVELFGGKHYGGPQVVTYTGIADLSPFSPQSLKLRRKAEIDLSPVYDPESREGESRRVIGVVARVALDRLQVDLATEHHQCATPCSDGACPPEGGFFFDPVYPLYEPKAPQKSWYGRHPMQLMINTSYFRICLPAKYHEVKCGNGSGLTIKGGKKLLDQSVPDDHGNLLDAVVFWRDGRVEFFRNQQIPNDLGPAEMAMSGNWFFTGDEFSCERCHEPDVRRPRTALGLDESNRSLTMIVIQTGYDRPNQGMTARDLYSFMRQRGVARGLMLDGGGSSQFVSAGKEEEPLWTVPPGDREGYRPVPSAFGIVGLREVK